MYKYLLVYMYLFFSMSLSRGGTKKSYEDKNLTYKMEVKGKARALNLEC